MKRKLLSCVFTIIILTPFVLALSIVTKIPLWALWFYLVMVAYLFA